MTEEQIKNRDITIRKNLLKHIEDLKTKIETNEDFPEGPQTIESLVQMDDNIEACLSCWYY